MLSCRLRPRNRAMPTFRHIPSIEEFLQRPALAPWLQAHGREAVTQAARDAAEGLRAALRHDATLAASVDAAADWMGTHVCQALAARVAPSLRRVINATGVIVHTNLGRAPLAREAIERLAAIGAGYTNLEYDLDRGGRGHRHAHAERLLCALTGAEGAAVVNNNAAATLLVLAALASGREVIVSRGEMVEIGGGFRVPEVMAQSGAVLREVGTTNRTRVADYAAAINSRTALILRVHPSNFRVEGFTERPVLDELTSVAHQFNLPVFEDLGSGWLGGSADAVPQLIDEPSVASSLAAGVDVVSFSGDKLLGGPQAGLIVGRRASVDAVRQHPLMRAVRADKLTYAALEATLALWAQAPGRASIPVYRMLTASLEALDRRAASLRDRLSDVAGLRAAVIDGFSTIGGGSAPGSQLPTRLVALDADGLTASSLEARLRAGDPPVIARIQDDRVVLDVRTIGEGEDDEIVRGVQS